MNELEVNESKWINILEKHNIGWKKQFAEHITCDSILKYKMMLFWGGIHIFVVNYKNMHRSDKHLIQDNS